MNIDDLCTRRPEARYRTRGRARCQPLQVRPDWQPGRAQLESVDQCEDRKFLSSGDRWPNRYDVCPSRVMPSRPRAPFGCRSAAECRAQTGCDLVVFGDAAYLSCAATSTWAEAGERCAGNGGRLVELANVAENDFVRGEIAVPVWVGLDDRAVEGTWSWQSGASQWFNWAPLQPDNSNNEDCASLSPSGTWNDLPCAGQAASVCETRREPAGAGQCVR